MAILKKEEIMKKKKENPRGVGDREDVRYLGDEEDPPITQLFTPRLVLRSYG